MTLQWEKEENESRAYCVSLALDTGDMSRSPGPHIFPLFSPGSPSPLFSWVNHTPTLRQPIGGGGKCLLVLHLQWYIWPPAP